MSMNSLQTELRRLYAPASSPGAGAAPLAALVAPPDRVRALVLELARPPSWQVLQRVWHGVQAELGLPAPAIAISGTDSLQLWFSLAEPVAAAPAHAFLERLRERFLPDVEPGRVRLWPTPDASAADSAGHTLPVPALQADGSGNWSAFVAQDLASVFADTPWLDIEPGEDGQAALLRDLDTIDTPAFAAAARRLGPAAPAAQPVAPLPAPAPPPAEPGGTDPRSFLLRVMNDEAVPMALRIEAARALLAPGG